MTIEEYPIKLLPEGEDNTHVKCIWFNENGELKKSSFSIECIETC